MFLYLYPPGTWWPSYTPWALGSLSVASYDSQGYDGGILTRLHTGYENGFLRGKCSPFILHIEH
jgi:hypothetical protein